MAKCLSDKLAACRGPILLIETIDPATSFVLFVRSPGDIGIRGRLYLDALDDRSR
jgi:hypothetical protein